MLCQDFLVQAIHLTTTHWVTPLRSIHLGASFVDITHTVNLLTALTLVSLTFPHVTWDNDTLYATSTFSVNLDSGRRAVSNAFLCG